MKRLIPLVFLLLLGWTGNTNNIKIKKAPSISHERYDADSVLLVRFDLSWENSWRSRLIGHYDAAWVFIKYQAEEFVWKHAYLADAGHQVRGLASRPAVDSVEFELGTSLCNGVQRNVGAFIYRMEENSAGPVDLKDVELVWDARGISFLDTMTMSVRVFAIEMVYIPSGPWVLGDDVAANRMIKYGNVLSSITANGYGSTPSNHGMSPLITSGLNGRSPINPLMTSNTSPAMAARAKPKYSPRSAECCTGNIAGTYESYITYTRSSSYSYTYRLYGDLSKCGSGDYRYWNPNHPGCSSPSGCGDPGGFDYYCNCWACTSHAFNNEPYKAFNRSTGSSWISVEGAGWNWVQYQYPPAEGRKATWMMINAYNYVQPYGCGSSTCYDDGMLIKGFYVEGSNDGVNFKLVHGTPAQTFSYPVYFGHQQYTPIVFDFPGYYEYYRFNFYTTEKTQVYDIQLFEGSPTDVNRIEDERLLELYDAAYSKSADIPESFPKGTKGFYMMKHEVTQSAYVDFLNTLTMPQQRRLVHATIGPFAAQEAIEYPETRKKLRVKEPTMGTEPAVYGLSVSTTGWYDEDQGGTLPMYGVSWHDAAAYLDWAALRPLTEMEYEKACRGDRNSTYYETAWGIPLSHAKNLKNTGLSNPYRYNEMPVYTADTARKVNYASPGSGADPVAVKNYFPVRVGSFAFVKTNRWEAGTSYYGVPNLSDNVPELYVTIDAPAGRKFDGAHGDGELTAVGDHDVPNWPTPDAGSNSGVGYRGVAVAGGNITGVLPVSDRRYSNTTTTTLNRDRWTGIRGGRTAKDK